MDVITNITGIVLVVMLALPLLSQALLHKPKAMAVMKYVIFGTYAAGYLFETILFREVMPEAQYELGLFWSYREAVALPGGFARLWQRISALGLAQGLKTILITDGELLEEIILNILLFVPMGYLLPITWPRLRGGQGPKHNRSFSARIKSFPWLVVAIGFAVSLATELTQLVFHIGLFEFDDLFNNTLGCFIGVICFMLARKLGLFAGKRE